jgi:hypothetical protein
MPPPPTSSPIRRHPQQDFGSASPARTILKEGGLSDPDNLVEVMAFAAIR